MNNTAQSDKTQQKIGNKCGHLPHAPRIYILPPTQKPLPTVIDKAIQNLKCIFYFEKRLLKSFNTLNPSGRYKRSERREAVMVVFLILLRHIQLETLEIVKSHTNQRPLDIDYIASESGFEPLRIQRAMWDMEDAGYLKIERQQRKKINGEYYATPSKRTLTYKFFIELGIKIKKLRKAIEWKIDKLKKEAFYKRFYKARRENPGLTELQYIRMGTLKKKPP